MSNQEQNRPKKPAAKYTLEQRLNIVHIFKNNNNSYSHTQRICRELYGPDMVPQYNTIKKYVKRFDETGSVADMTPRYEVVFEWELTDEERQKQREQARRRKMNKELKLAQKQTMENATIVHAIQAASSSTSSQNVAVQGPEYNNTYHPYNHVVYDYNNTDANKRSTTTTSTKYEY